MDCVISLLINVMNCFSLATHCITDYFLLMVWTRTGLQVLHQPGIENTIKTKGKINCWRSGGYIPEIAKETIALLQKMKQPLQGNVTRNVQLMVNV